MSNIRPNAKRAKNAITFIWFVMGAGLLNLIYSTITYNSISYYYDNENLLTYDNNIDYSLTLIIFIQGFISLIYIVFMVVSIITFIMWFRRAYFNLHQKINLLQYKDGFASGGWFIPIGNLFIPFQIMRELYTNTHKLLDGQNNQYTKPLRLNGLAFWWILWIISRITNRLSSVVTKLDNTTEYSVIYSFQIIEMILIIPLSIITVKIIKDYSLVEYLLTDNSHISNQYRTFPDEVLDSGFISR